MTTTRTITPQARHFLDEVSERLSGLTDEERAEVLSDLEAHLSELADADLAAELGDPETFANDFLDSAGLDRTYVGQRRFGRRTRRVVETLESRAAMLVEHPRVERIGQRWRDFRPAWIAVRGWVLISVLALGTAPAFSRFPIPNFANRTLYGLAAVAVATWLSYRVANRSDAREMAVDTGFTWLSLASLTLSVIFGLGSSTEIVYIDGEPAMDSGFNQYGLPLGGSIQNIYAYDRNGNPVEVLLYDHDGNPIRLIDPNLAGIDDSSVPYFRFGDREIRPTLDRYDRPIWNLYPLDQGRVEWNDQGQERLIDEAPPVVGIPESVSDLAEKTVPNQPTQRTRE